MPKTFFKSKPKTLKVRNLGPIESYHFDRRIPQILSFHPPANVLYSPDLAHWLGVSEIAVKFWRLRKCGPPYNKPRPHTVCYSRDVVEQWLSDRQATLAKAAGVKS